jgi:predicted RNase H-like HicB family nuclease
MRYKVSYLNQGEEGWLASIYILPGCHTEAPTKEEARTKLWSALLYYFDDLSDTELVDESDWTD